MNKQNPPRQDSARAHKAEAAKQMRENMRMLINGFRGWVESAMRPQGMTVPQLRLLFAVHKDPEGSSASLARQCQVTPQTLQGMLQRAVRQGWLVRRPAARNARILTAALTPEGQALLDRAQDRFSEFELLVWRDASAQELNTMNAFFANAIQRVEEAEALQSLEANQGRTGKTKSVAKR